MTTFAAPASTLEARAPDASKHVNYTLGMVLGVDDFNQEFAYLAGRDRWLARDAIGYGTLNGLRITTDEVASKGPRVTVTSGTALTPKGQLVCVKPAQCAYLNDWLDANKTVVDGMIGSPLTSSISLYLTLCYRDCPVDLIPIPGEPCRSEDELMKPSRLADDFSLELRTTAPDQSEEDLLREFVAWLRMLAFGGGGPYATIPQFENALRASVVSGIGSPPSSPLSPLSSPLSMAPKVHFNFGSPIATLRLDPLLAPEYYRAAFGIWIEEIRPLVHAVCCGGGGGCCSAKDSNEPKTDECLLLARVEVPVLMSSGKWVVDDLRDVVIDESRRPMLVHLRLLQELAVPLGGGGGAAGPRIVAAGLVGIAAPATTVFGNLVVTSHGAGTSRVRLNFTGYSPANRYIVKALGNTTVNNPTIAYDNQTNDGIILRLSNGAAALNDATLADMRLMIEITQVQ